VIFYAIYKNHEITFTIGVHLLQQGPWADFGFRNVVLGRGGRRGLGKFRRCAAGFRPGRVGEGSMGHGGSVSWVGRGRGGSGGGAHRQPAAASAAAGQASEGGTSGGG
jgi:hypothetical protein